MATAGYGQLVDEDEAPVDIEAPEAEAADPDEATLEVEVDLTDDANGMPECVARKYVEVFENERWSTFFGKWSKSALMPTDPGRFTDKVLKHSVKSLGEVECPPHLQWAEGAGWSLDRQPAPRGGTDPGGWFYGPRFSNLDTQLAVGKTKASKKRQIARTRRWVRKCVLKPEALGEEPPLELGLSIKEAPDRLCSATAGAPRRLVIGLQMMRWRGYVGMRDSLIGWFQTYLVLTVFPEPMLVRMSAPINPEYREHWTINTDVQIFDRGDVSQPALFAIRQQDEEEVTINAASVGDKESLMLAVESVLESLRAEKQEEAQLEEEALREQNAKWRQASEEAAAAAAEEEAAISARRPRDKLIVTVYSAQELRGKGGGFSPISGDVSDPYVVIKASPTQGKPQSFRTRTIEDSVNPVWVSGERSAEEEKAQFEFHNIRCGAATVVAVVRDSNSLARDSDLGYVSFRLRSIPINGEQETMKIFRLSPEGKLVLGIRWMYAVGAEEEEALTIPAVVKQLKELPKELEDKPRPNIRLGLPIELDENGADEAADMRETALAESKAVREKPPSGEYTLIVYVAEARDLHGHDADGACDACVFVKALGEEASTRVVKNIRNPVFDQTLFLQVGHADEQALTANAVKVEVFDMNTLLRNRLVGANSMDLLQLFYAANGRTVRNVWIALVDADRIDGGVQGYVRVSAQLVAPGDEYRPGALSSAPAVAKEDEDDDEGGDSSGFDSSLVLLPPSVKQEVHFLVVSIRRAELPGLALSEGEVETFVRVAFNGLEVRTPRQSGLSPAWRLQFWLPVVLPTCGNIISVALMEPRRGKRSDCVAAVTVDFTDVDADDDALPNYSWVQLYSKCLEPHQGDNVWKRPAGTAYDGALLAAFSRAGKDSDLDLRAIPYVRDLPIDEYEPEEDKYQLRLAVIAGADLPTGRSLRVVAEWGAYQWVSEAIEADDGGNAEWLCELERSGSIERELVLPAVENASQLPDVLVHLCDDDGFDGDGSKLKRLASTRLIASRLLDLCGEVTPQWRMLESCDPDEFARAPGPSLQLCGGLAPCESTQEQWQQAELTLNAFQLPQPAIKGLWVVRLHLYQARHMAGAPDVRVRIQSQGQMDESEVVHANSAPQWFVTLRLRLYSAKPEASPDIVLSMWDEGRPKSRSLLAFTRLRPESAVQLNYASEESVPELPAPEWRPLTPVHASARMAPELLYTLEVIRAPADEETSTPPPPLPELRPHTARAYAQIVVVGLRGLQPLNRSAPQRPHILFSTGAPTSVELSRATSKSSAPTTSDPNYNEQVLLPIELPDNHIFCPAVQAQIVDERCGGLFSYSLGRAAIPIAGRIPWQSRRTADSVARAELYENESYNHVAGHWEPTIEPPHWSDRRLHPQSKEEVQLRGPKWTWKGDWEVHRGPDTDRDGYQYALAMGLNGAGAFFKGDHLWSGKSRRGVRRRLWTRTQEVAPADTPLAKQLNPSLADDGVGGADSAADAAVRLRSELQQPLLAAADDDEDDEDDEDLAPYQPLWAVGRAECRAELESRFSPDKVPFDKFDFYEGQHHVATMKGIVRVVRYQEEAMRGLPLAIADLLQPKRYQVVLYVIRAERLTPADYVGTSDPYLKVRIGSELVSRRDEKLSRVTDADFYQRFELQTWLPGSSELHIDVYDYDEIGSDDHIGGTTIDLEARVFNPEWAALEPKPFEWRQLHNRFSKAPQGLLQCWVDIHPHNSPETRPPLWDVAPPPQQDWELRVVVWCTENVVPSDWLTSMNDMYAVVRCGGSDSPVQETDTHWRCSNGNASFNWRCKFAVKLGPRRQLDERLTLQLWDRDVGINDTIGEVVVPLQKFFAKAFREGSRVHAVAPPAAGKVPVVAAAKAGTEAAAAAAVDAAAATATAVRLKSLHFEGDRKMGPKSRALGVIDGMRTYWKESESTEAMGTSDGFNKFWLPVFSSEGSDRGDERGWVQLSMELVPAKIAEAMPNGVGRADPNQFPTLPEPVGRFKFSLNPFKTMLGLLGPSLCMKVGCCFFILLALIFGTYVMIELVPAILANIIV